MSKYQQLRIYLKPGSSAGGLNPRWQIVPKDCIFPYVEPVETFVTEGNEHVCLGYSVGLYCKNRHGLVAAPETVYEPYTGKGPDPAAFQAEVERMGLEPEVTQGPKPDNDGMGHKPPDY